LTKQEFVASLTETDIVSVYSGVNGKCCCGCSGKHTTNPLYKALSGEERGYPVDDEECNAKKVKAILNKIKKWTAAHDWSGATELSVEDGYVSIVSPETRAGRLYIAYLVPTDEEIEANRKRRAENKIKTA
jgi:hypothetical protein